LRREAYEIAFVDTLCLNAQTAPGGGNLHDTSGCGVEEAGEAFVGNGLRAAFERRKAVRADELFGLECAGGIALKPFKGVLRFVVGDEGFAGAEGQRGAEAIGGAAGVGLKEDF
jgi:hypothetical protein